MPRFLLRLPYGEKTVPVKAFNFNEDVGRQATTATCGATPSFAFATRVADSFAKYRWCPNIIGPQSGGAVENLPLHQYEAMGEIQTKIPTEVLLTERREFELSEEGFIGLTFRKDSRQRLRSSRPTRCRSRSSSATAAEGKAAETNYRLGTQLPVHVHHHPPRALHQGAAARADRQLEGARATSSASSTSGSASTSRTWTNPAPSVRSRRPLRKAQITVEDVEGQPGWYRCRHVRCARTSSTWARPSRCRSSASSTRRDARRPARA